MKKITINELENGETSLNVDEGVKWSTFITGIEMLIEGLTENALENTTIEDILDDIRRIYERDNKVDKWKIKDLH